MTNNRNTLTLMNMIQRPILTDKTTLMVEDNKYYFAVTTKAKKSEIKKAVEQLFDVKVEKINTLIVKSKKKRIGKHIGYKSKYKKAVVKLKNEYRINLFSDN
uniref:ribosomal protein L23 n=1 Tax=Gracilaria baiana TaxID=2873517 RepID=UPI001D1160EA|nr:ribosomal protein L23 [Gracilaria baiana]UAD82975.1 ribosomal protein L23 [Gracilaria baiana]